MCVAVLVEKDNPTADEIRAMARANRDGAGLAWVDGAVIRYRRGLTVERVLSIVKDLPRPYFMHFRIATRGRPIPALTHPFPVGFAAISSADELSGIAGAVLMHNGTWSGYEKWIPGGIDRGEVSDTQIAAYVAAFHEEILDEVGWSNALMKASGDGRADIVLRGQWTEHNGNSFSNMHWNKPEIEEYGGWTYSDFYGRYDSRGTTPSRGVSHWTPSMYGGSRQLPPPRTASKDVAVDIARDMAREKELRSRLSRAEMRAARKAARRTQKLASQMKDDPIARAEARCDSGLALSGDFDNEPTIEIKSDGTWSTPLTRKGWSGDRLFTDDELSGKGDAKDPVYIGYSPDGKTHSLIVQTIEGPQLFTFDCLTGRCVKREEITNEQIERAVYIKDYERTTAECSVRAASASNDNTAGDTHPTIADVLDSLSEQDPGDSDEETKMMDLVDIMESIDNAPRADEHEHDPEVEATSASEASMRAAGDYLTSEWDEIDAAIRAQGIKV